MISLGKATRPASSSALEQSEIRFPSRAGVIVCTMSLALREMQGARRSDAGAMPGRTRLHSLPGVGTALGNVSAQGASATVAGPPRWPFASHAS
jgi:hypothetical protein